ncbi:hypothetical protein BDV30DRAFT_204672 [Aspergillus minisclerotigenes]|uniref:Uncharacterized protein n=1 Tax=Aspergillus minisclerotigenes TaxID=656917 RepID=A0A5N6JH02_9EURO|nr:hypothetical protein BDV30DRAFT_204672 [Aspergillus minisclerotigenes]
MPTSHIGKRGCIFLFFPRGTGLASSVRRAKRVLRLGPGKSKEALLGVWVRIGVSGELVGIGSLVLLEVTPSTSSLHSVIEGAVSPVGRVTALTRPSSVPARPVVVLPGPFDD